MIGHGFDKEYISTLDMIDSIFTNQLIIFDILCLNFDISFENNKKFLRFFMVMITPDHARIRSDDVQFFPGTGINQSLDRSPFI